ncbi:MAG TPA: OB-fold nucleic acid binding domain-containing protein, partial [Solirubrobacteraceae bacterium]|nr:OB-fold nucleic acid binding domain-containing protein [Solirubrobacteraceae bacterium]
IQEAETTGVFQIESRAQMGSLRRTRPENLDDLTIQVAIVRPGPIQGGAVNPYIERRQRLRVEPDYAIPYEHPSLEPVLRDTLGTIIFQDQVIEVSMAFSGFSPGEAEGLRRAMSRKRSAEAIESHHRSFVEGAMDKWPDVDEALAERVWSMVVGFSGFGFPKAHGAAFGLLAYQSTWLRVHYGPEFLCSLLDEQPMGFYPPDALIHEAQRRGIEVLAPDVNASEVGCTVVDVPAAVLPFRPRPAREPALVTVSPASPTPLPVRTATAPARAAVRLGLGYVLGVRGDEVAALVAAREADGPFRSLDDLAARAGAGRPALAQLAWSGACDGLAGGRRPALWRLGAAAPPHAAGAGGTQLSLGLELPAAPALAALDDWDAMIADYATTGLTVDRHPLRLLREGLRARGICSSADLEGLPHGAHVRVGGIVVARQRPGTAKGVVFLLLEDETGTVNVIIPPKVYARDRLTVRTEPLVVVEGALERFASAGGAINLLVRRLAPLDAPDLLSRRPRAEVKDFSMLDARELARIALEQPRVAVAAAGGATAAHVRPAAPAGLGPARQGAAAAAAATAATAPGPGAPAAGRAEPELAEPLPAGGTGAEDFRAVAPPIMSFAQGRRR